MRFPSTANDLKLCHYSSYCRARLAADVELPDGKKLIIVILTRAGD
jgi:hypothetical protein